MITEEKQLLLKDLCTRLPYGVKVSNGGYAPAELSPVMLANLMKGVSNIKPYLRSMSSMTEEEEIYYNTVYTTLKFYEKEDWLNANHFNYRLPPHLFIEAPEGMYKTE